MSSNLANDPRTTLVRTKYFSLHPKPLERWLWQQGLPQTAERVFWVHWEAGMRSGDWCSEISIKRVARECCVDPSTVTRAYQLLKTRGLIRREDAGRNPHNPFQQAIAITEVRLPRDLLVELARSPNRSGAPQTAAGHGIAQATGASRGVTPGPPTTQSLPSGLGFAKTEEGASAATAPHDPPIRPTRQDIQALWARASAGENARYFAASRDRHTTMEFDLDSRLTPADRALVGALLAQQAVATPPAMATRVVRTPVAPGAGPRRLSVLELARARRHLTACASPSRVAELLRQVVWSVEEGALRRFSVQLALNIAFKKIREGAWSTPSRLPPTWLCRSEPVRRASAEQCVDA